MAKLEYQVGSDTHSDTSDLVVLDVEITSPSVLDVAVGEATELTVSAAPDPAAIGGVLTWSVIAGGYSPTGTFEPNNTDQGTTSFTATAPGTGWVAVNYSYGGKTASDSIELTVTGIEYIKVRPYGETGEFTAETRIAAGGLSGAVHKAEVEMKIAPVPLGSYSIDCPVTLEDADGQNDTPTHAKLYMGGPLVQVGNGDGTVTFSSADGRITGYLLSSDTLRTCAIQAKGGTAEADVVFDWEEGGAYDFAFPYYFMPGVADDVKFFPTLHEIAILDEDGDGTTGERAVVGHQMKFFTSRITVKYWKQNLATGDYIDLPDFLTVANPDVGNPDVIYGKKVNDLVLQGATTEDSPGVYKNAETVQDHRSVVGDVETVIEVWHYRFAVYDTELCIPE